MTQRIMGRQEMLTMRPGDVQAGDAFAVKVVAVAGHCGDWAAYMGPASWSDERVMEAGEKLGREQATRLFYVMSGREYRE